MGDSYPLIWRAALCVILQDISQAFKLPNDIGVPLSIIVSHKTVFALEVAVDDHGHLHVRVTDRHGDSPCEIVYNGLFFVSYAPLPF